MPGQSFQSLGSDPDIVETGPSRHVSAGSGCDGRGQKSRKRRDKCGASQGLIAARVASLPQPIDVDVRSKPDNARGRAALRANGSDERHRIE